MKKFQFALVAISLLLASCSESLEDSLVGTWNLESWEITGCNDPSENFAQLIADDMGCVTDGGSSICQTVVVADNGTYVNTVNIGGDIESINGTFTVSEDDVATFCEGGECYTPEIDGDILTLTDVDAEDGCTFTRTYKKQ